MCQRGNRDDVDRQNFIEISSVDSFSPNMTLFQGVNSYSLVDKDVISYGVDNWLFDDGQNVLLDNNGVVLKDK